MIRARLALAVLIGLALPATGWAIPQEYACRHGARIRHDATRAALVCGLHQDPWQDCNEDPWQISASLSSELLFLEDTVQNPWQDSADPWQPFAPMPPTEPGKASNGDRSIDPWQPAENRPAATAEVALLRDSVEDPWQPVYPDPWQDKVEDPWQ